VLTFATEPQTAQPAPSPPGEIERLDSELSARFKDRLLVHTALTRQLVSFQANKHRAAFRWYKYKEAFSAGLIEYLLRHCGVTAGRVLDPFAGSGTALFVAAAQGLDADGIELLGIGQQIISTRRTLESFTAADFAALSRWSSGRPWERSETRAALPELRITRGAYPEATKNAIEKYLGTLPQENERVQAVLRLALLCVLEQVSYTRKDGQYLRWDYRSGRRQGKKGFDKGPILEFSKAVSAKLDEIVHDQQPGAGQAGLFPAEAARGAVSLHHGSCLDVLPDLAGASYDAVLTSPPYCNRYDYTRTYALELALLGAGEKDIINLRQQMLSCTVENRAKDLLRINPAWAEAVAAADRQRLLQAILKYLEQCKDEGALNNTGILRMVRGYFYEMACVIAECARVMKTGASLLMVNDNVRYAGASVSVDLILSDLAEQLGFRAENILVLPDGKGNSSQQMGRHGREALRKCVCVWRKF
jgi:DNA modification methylase